MSDEFVKLIQDDSHVVRMFMVQAIKVLFVVYRTPWQVQPAAPAAQKTALQNTETALQKVLVLKVGDVSYHCFWCSFLS